MDVSVIVPGTPEWLEARRGKWCSSDGPRALGYSRYGNGLDVCLEKWGEAPKVEETPQMRRGTLLQPAMALAYQMRTGQRLGDEFYLVHPTEDWMAATPDAPIMNNGKKHVQIKTHNRFLADEYGPDGSEEVPDRERIQVMHEMACTNNQSCDIAVVFADESAFQLLVSMVDTAAVEIIANALLNLDYRIHTIHRDLDLEQDYIDFSRDFWTSYVLPHKYPPDAPMAQDDGSIRMATAEEIALMEGLKGIKQVEFMNEAEFESVKARLIKCIGERGGIDTGRSDLGKVTYKKTKDTTVPVTDFEAIAREIGATDEVVGKHTELTPITDWESVVKEVGVSLDIIKKYTTDKVTRKGSRRFCPATKAWKKEFTGQ